mmetsp:Transcript_11656/g.25214  ORF Transcript_11656/g.25214 Transcript_11656/m.25214 type:complete len:290 (+) Transcript_11656:127-996(+)
MRKQTHQNLLQTRALKATPPRKPRRLWSSNTSASPPRPLTWTLKLMLMTMPTSTTKCWTALFPLPMLPCLRTWRMALLLLMKAMVTTRNPLPMQQQRMHRLMRLQQMQQKTMMPTRTIRPPVWTLTPKFTTPTKNHPQSWKTRSPCTQPQLKSNNFQTSTTTITAPTTMRTLLTMTCLWTRIPLRSSTWRIRKTWPLQVQARMQRLLFARLPTLICMSAPTAVATATLLLKVITAMLDSRATLMLPTTKMGMIKLALQATRRAMTRRTSATMMPTMPLATSNSKKSPTM